MTVDRLDTLARPIRLLFLDVDGVLADGGILLGEAGELKRFAARDGTASYLSRRVDLELMLVTFRDSEAVRRRAAELGVEAEQGIADKLSVVERVCAARELDLSEVAFMGDDLVDLKAMRAVGLAIAPRDAAVPALRLAHIVTRSPGGHGAVREAVEVVMWLNRVQRERETDA
ncbi:MAG: HAD hydrolase family protein [Candidatus Eiseniibacteriota bacterium]|jgi:3-deoxy-D-manno-octulosonate 8-phosphate phosphatase (KDO 8-P phosphatase)